MSHNLERERCRGRVGMRLSGHISDALAETGVSERYRRISADKQLVNRLALLQSRAGTVLPENRGGVGQRAHKAVVAAHQRPVAQVKALVEYLPELIVVSAGRAGDVDEIQRDDALIEPTVELVVPVLVLPRGERAAAAHDREAVSLLELLHLLL